MININYQSYGSGFNLRLRIYQDGKTKYISVNKFLQGDLKKRHWNQKKQCFISSAPYADENNEMLVKFKNKYDSEAMDWGGSVSGLLRSVEVKDAQKRREKPSVHDLFVHILSHMLENKHKDGSVKGTYENYEKVEKRLKEFCKYKNYDYDDLIVEEIDKDFINSIFSWVNKQRNGKGMEYISKVLHAMFMKADRLGWFDFNTIKGANWAKKTTGSSQKYYTLTPEQCNKFIAMTPEELPKSKLSKLYHDICVFILFTGQSLCDAVSLKYSDIKEIDGVDHFVFYRRKIEHKQKVACTVPINPVMRQIMDYWKPRTRDGYVLPVRTKYKLETQKTTNGDIKHLVNRLNLWLVKLAPLLDCGFKIHTYTFRHTAITNYISKSVPVLYVANMMGTSVKNCETIYYNNRGDSASRNKVLGITSF